MDVQIMKRSGGAHKTVGTTAVGLVRAERTLCVPRSAGFWVPGTRASRRCYAARRARHRGVTSVKVRHRAVMASVAAWLYASQAGAFCQTTTCDIAAAELSEHPECTPVEHNADKC